jgi:uncharacterized protein YjaG (DUF416 family)
MLQYTLVIQLDDLVSAVGSLDYPASVVFSAAIAERMLPIYEAFATAQDWGEPLFVRQQVDRVWSTLAGSRVGSNGDLEKPPRLASDEFRGCRTLTPISACLRHALLKQQPTRCKA